MYVYLYSLHVSGNCVPIISALPGICHSVWTTVWYARCNETPTCILDSHLHTVTYTRYHIDAVNSPDDGNIVAQNM
jgi:hypothetical protein